MVSPPNEFEFLAKVGRFIPGTHRAELHCRREKAAPVERRRRVLAEEFVAAEVSEQVCTARAIILDAAMEAAKKW